MKKVGDVAQVLASLMKDDRGVGKVIELAGPKEYYFKNLVEMWNDLSKRNVDAIPVPKSVFKLGASLLDRVTVSPIISPDEVERVQNI